MAWSDRPKNDRYALIGVFVGMAIAAVAVFVFAIHAGMIVRYLIMATGVVLGWATGRWLGSRP